MSFFSKLKTNRFDGRRTVIPGILGAYGEVGFAFNLTNGESVLFGELGTASGFGAEASLGFSIGYGTLSDAVGGGATVTAGKGGLFGSLGLDGGSPNFGLSFGKGAFAGIKKSVISRSTSGNAPDVQRCINTAIGLGVPICR